MAQTSCVLGIDLGTSAIKILAISPKGRIVASAREPYTTIMDGKGQAEQNCQHWIKALTHAARKIHSNRARNLRVEAIALTGQMPTLVVLDAERPLGQAITWQDSRADSWVSQRLDNDLRRRVYKKTGVVIDGRYLAPMFQFHHGRRKGNLRILSAKDFLFHALTGAAATDPSTASGYGLYNLKSGSWDAELCQLWDIGLRQLPRIMKSSCSTPLSSAGSKLLNCAAGVPVFVGCADSAAGVYALSGEKQSTTTVNMLMGSSTVIIACDSEPHWDPHSRYLITPLAVDGTYGREADLLSSGSAREWAEKTLFAGKNYKARWPIWRAAYDVAPGAGGLLFAPYLAGGEQGILWNPELRGMLVGLTLAHQLAQIARALLEGIFFEMRRCLELLTEDKRLTSLHVTGWVSYFPEELQMLADILGRPVRAFRLQSASAVGAALLTKLINYSTYRTNMRLMVYKPSKHRQAYNKVFENYLAQFPTGACATR